MHKIAIMIDAGFLSAVFKDKVGRKLIPNDVIKLSKKIIGTNEKLFRIYYYDCPPIDGSFTNPIDKRVVDYSKSSYYHEALEFQRQLAEMDYIAFRKGELRGFGWKLKDWALTDIESKNPQWVLKSKHIDVNLMQKGIDMRIGLDIASISTKRIVDEIVIVTGDTDFIPAMKYARKEGCLISIVDIGSHLRTEMKQHADTLRKIDLTKI